MKLSRTVAYGLRAALHLASQKTNAPVPCSRLAKEGKMPERFLLQILRRMVTHGVLKSTRGVDGGYSLGRPTKEITLLDIVEAIEGPLAYSIPTIEMMPAKSHKTLNDRFAKIVASNREALGKIKLSALTR